MSNQVVFRAKGLEDYVETNLASFIRPGDGGFWLDFGDWDNLFQDTAMTQKITAPGQQVAAARDKGVNALHVNQLIAANRPISAIDGGKQCIRLNRANFQHMVGVGNGRIARRQYHGWVIGRILATNANQRYMSTCTNNSNSDLQSLGFAINQQSASTWALSFGAYGVGAGAGNGPNSFKGLREYKAVGTSGSTRMNIYSDNVSGAEDTLAVQNQFASSPLFVGTGSRNLAATAGTSMDGFLHTILHLGTLPNETDELAIETWLNAKRRPA